MRSVQTARVRPRSYRGRLSGGCSREGHCRRFVCFFPWFGHCTSIFLRPFAPPALPGFIATMDALTPRRRALRILIGDNEHRPVPSRSPFFTCSTFRPFRPQPPSCHLPFAALARYFSRMGRRVYPPGRQYFSRRDFAVARAEVRHWLEGSPTGSAESGSSSYGLVVHLQLLSTPPHGDAVTVNYRFVTQTSWGLAPH